MPAERTTPRSKRRFSRGYGQYDAYDPFLPVLSRKKIRKFWGQIHGTELGAPPRFGAAGRDQHYHHHKRN